MEELTYKLKQTKKVNAKDNFNHYTVLNSKY